MILCCSIETSLCHCVTLFLKKKGKMTISNVVKCLVINRIAVHSSRVDKLWTPRGQILNLMALNILNIELKLRRHNFLSTTTIVSCPVESSVSNALGRVNLCDFVGVIC